MNVKTDVFRRIKQYVWARSNIPLVIKRYFIELQQGASGTILQVTRAKIRLIDLNPFIKVLYDVFPLIAGEWLPCLSLSSFLQLTSLLNFVQLKFTATAQITAEQLHLPPLLPPQQRLVYRAEQKEWRQLLQHRS